VPAAVEERAELRISHDSKADPPTCEAEPPPHGVRLCACVPAANKRDIVTTLGETAVSDVVKKVRAMRLFAISICVVTLDIYIYKCIYICMYIHIYVYTSLSLSNVVQKVRAMRLFAIPHCVFSPWICMYIRICIYVYIYMYMYIYICICTFIYIYVERQISFSLCLISSKKVRAIRVFAMSHCVLSLWIHICIYIYIYIHIYIYEYIYIHIYI